VKRVNWLTPPKAFTPYSVSSFLFSSFSPVLESQPPESDRSVDIGVERYYQKNAFETRVDRVEQTSSVSLRAALTHNTVWSTTSDSSTSLRESISWRPLQASPYNKRLLQRDRRFEASHTSSITSVLIVRDSVITQMTTNFTRLQV
jgi:hypothetical protein